MGIMITQKRLVKITLFSLLTLVSIGLLSKKRIALDYVIHQSNCQLLSVNSKNIELIDQQTNSIICEKAEAFYLCSHYDQYSNQLTEAKKFFIKHERNHELHLVTKDNLEEMTINFHTKHVANRQLEDKKQISTKVCTGTLYNKKQSRERFPELIAGRR